MDEYRYTDVEVLRVLDGDTVDLRLTKDIGFYHAASVCLRFRLVEIDTPERGAPNHAEATEFTREWLELRKGNLVAVTFKHEAPAVVPDGGFGRWLVDIHSFNGQRLVDALKAQGLAVPYRRGN